MSAKSADIAWCVYVHNIKEGAVAKRELTKEELKALPGKVSRAIRAGKLTTDEEKVLRMRYGLAEADDAEIEFRGQDNDLTRIRLAQMENKACGKMGLSTPVLKSRTSRYKTNPSCLPQT